MAYQDVMAMPVRTFWMFNSFINRLRAEEKADQVGLYLLANMGTDANSITTFTRECVSEMGTVITYDGEKPREVTREEHREGIKRLKQLSRKMRR